MAHSKPTVLFVHGAWHQPVHFDRVCKTFQEADYSTSCPALPSCSGIEGAGLAEDAKCIEDKLYSLIDDHNKDVIVIGNSYGGMVMTEACKQVFSKQDRSSRGFDGGIVRLVYTTAFLAETNTTILDKLAKIPRPDWIVADEDGMCHVINADKVFYNDLPPEEQDFYASKLTKQHFSVQITPITHPAYLYHPITYLICENDQGLPKAIQEEMITRISSFGGVVLDTVTCSAGHCPFLSQPEEILAVVERIITA